MSDISSLTWLRPEWGIGALIAVLVILPIVIFITWKVRTARDKRHTRHTRIPKATFADRVKPFVVNALLVMIVVILVAMAGEPAMATKIAKEEALVCYIADGSTSMSVNDVAPTRDAALKDALTTTILNSPDDTRFCVVSFAGEGDIDIVLEDSLNKEEAVRRIAEMQLRDTGTDVAGGILTTIELMESMEDSPLRSPEELADGDEPPVAFVLLSDGESSGQPLEAAAKAAEMGIPIHTISYGTTLGAGELHYSPLLGEPLNANPDPATMQAIADTTTGDPYEADSGVDLEKIFDSVTSRVATETVHDDVMWYLWVALAATFLARFVLVRSWFA